MKHLMIVMIAAACLLANASEERQDQKSLVSPQTLSCELRNVRFTRDIVDVSSDTRTLVRGTDTATSEITQTDASASRVRLSSDRVIASRIGAGAKVRSEFTAEGGVKFGVKPAYGSVGGRVSIEGEIDGRITKDDTNVSKLKSEVSSGDTEVKSFSVKQEKEVEGSDKFSLGMYRLKFTVVLDNRAPNDKLTVVCSNMNAKLSGEGLDISAPYGKQTSSTLVVGRNPFEFEYPITDVKDFNRLKELSASGRLGQLDLSKSGADIPVINEAGENVLIEQSKKEAQRRCMTILTELERFGRVTSWRVSKYHTAGSGREGAPVTLKEAFTGIASWAPTFSDTLVQPVFEFSGEGALTNVLGCAAIGEDKVFALRMKDNNGKTDLGLPSAERLALHIEDYSEIALISFSFEEFAEWAVRYPRYFEDLKKEIENKLAAFADEKASLAFKEKIEAKQHEEDVRPLNKYETITKDDVDRFRDRAKANVAEMQFKLARCLFEGWCISRNEAEAFEWFSKAAENGNADGQFYLGYCYMCGIGVAKNEGKAVEWYTKAAEQQHLSAKDKLNLLEQISKGEIAGAAKKLSARFNDNMSMGRIAEMLFWIEKLTAKLRGGYLFLSVKKFTPPDRDDAYERVKSGQAALPPWLINRVSNWFVDWKTDAQRVVVAEEYLNETALLPANDALKELDRFDGVMSMVEKLNVVVSSLGRVSSEDQGCYIDVEKNISSIMERLKDNKKRFLSYEVVSPYLYEAHANLFVGFSDSVRASSFDKAYGEDKVKEYRTTGYKLMKELSDHHEWLDSCAWDVREQFEEVQKFKRKVQKKYNEND